MFRRIALLFLGFVTTETLAFGEAVDEVENRTLAVRIGSVYSLAFSPDGKYLAAGGADQSVHVWDAKSWLEVQRLSGHSDTVHSVAFSPDGKYLASASWDKTVRTWDAKNWSEVHKSSGHPSLLLSVAFSPDSKYLAAAGIDETVRVWNTQRWKDVKRLTGFPHTVYALAFSPDGKYLALGCSDETVRIWATQVWKEVLKLSCRSHAAYALAFSPDGQFLSSGGSDQTIRIWETRTWREIQKLSGHSSFVQSVAFSPDGKHLASAAWDETVRIWDTQSWREVKSLRGHSEDVYAVAFSTDGKSLASGSSDETVRIWDWHKFIYVIQPAPLTQDKTGTVLARLLMGSKVEVEAAAEDHVYVTTKNNLKGWIKRKFVSLKKPDMRKPVIRVISKNIAAGEIYIKGVAYDDGKVSRIEFCGQSFERIKWYADQGEFADAFAFEGKVVPPAESKMILKAEDESGKVTEMAVNMEEPILDYTPKYAFLQAQSNTDTRKEPSAKSAALLSVSAGTILKSIGQRESFDKPGQVWYFLEEGGWALSGAVKEIEEVLDDEKQPLSGTPGEPVDIDVNLPVVTKTRPESLAVIFGIENYKNVSNVTHARRDAIVFKEYAVKIFGVPHSRNSIYFLTEDVTLGEFRKVFGENGWLARRVKRDSDVYIFYAGHGVPDPKSNSAFLFPQDGDPNYAKETGFSLNELNRFIGTLRCNSVTVFLDACFSGADRENKVLYAMSRPVPFAPAISAEESDKKRISIYYASKGNQISSSYAERQHGLFSYFLMKGLRGEGDLNKDGALTSGELQDYLRENVEEMATILDREQSPELVGDPSRVLVRYK